MSTWNIGQNDVSDEVRGFKDKLASKETQIAAQQAQLLKQAAESDDLKAALNDALHKLSQETGRIIRLETELSQRSEDLRREKLATENANIALSTAQEKAKLKELEARELQTNLDSLSSTADDQSCRNDRLECERSALEARIRELETNIRHIADVRATSDKHPPSPDSTILQSRVTVLERELQVLRDALSQKEDHLSQAMQKVSRLQNNLVTIENEKSASQKNVSQQIEALRSTLEEKEQELCFYREQNNAHREEDLLRRIEEDEAKIAALESLLVASQDVQPLKDEIRVMGERLAEERKRASELEGRHVELVQEKEEALDELEVARSEIQRLSTLLTRPHESNQFPSIPPSAAENMDLSGMDTEASETTGSMPDETSVAHIERLLSAIDRLRGERDTLRRDLEYLETESKFTIESLEAKLSMGAGINASHPRQAYAAPSVKCQEASKPLQSAVLASALVIQHLQSEITELEHTVLLLNETRAQMEGTLVDTETRLKELEEKMKVTDLCLEATTSQRDDLTSQLEVVHATHREEIHVLKALYREAKDNLEQTELHLSDVAKALEAAESERNSLTLQVTNLMTDLHAVQEDLVNAENRYSSLQSHQLSSMSSTEATRTLQDQIEELEMRVMRRTEQIGIHQHDIRRLEANLRLQEERFAEMTMELEMMAAQKDAMVEDCADAREARDEALARLDRMEMEMEATAEAEDVALTTMVEVLMKTVSGSKDAIRQLNAKAQQAKQEVRRLTAEHDMALYSQSSSNLEAHRIEVETQKMVQQLIIALAVSQTEMKKALCSLRLVDDEKRSLEQEVQKCRDELEQVCNEASSLKVQLESLQKELALANSDFALRIKELDLQIENFKEALLIEKSNHDRAVGELEQTRQQLEKALDISKPSYKAGIDESLIDELRGRCAEAETKLMRTSDELRKLETTHAEADAEYHKTLADLMASKAELEKQVASSSYALQVSVDEQAQLQRDLETATTDACQANESLSRLRESYRQLEEKLLRVRKVQEDELAVVSDESTSIKIQLGKEIADLRGQLEIKARELEQALQKIERLDAQLRSEVESRSLEQKTFQEDVCVIQDRAKDAEMSLAQLTQDLHEAQAELGRAKAETNCLQEEKSILLEQITSIEAETQKSMSVVRFLESQVKESENKVSLLTAELDQMKMNLARSEKLAKTAEVNFSLQGAQHKREMADLQREITCLKARPNLQEALAELEERNNEMEELLRHKCAEIEANDDRALEMLKENKKLTTKVENLTRKVQNLQTKLTAAKAATTPPQAQQPHRHPSEPMVGLSNTANANAASTIQRRPSARSSDACAAEPLNRMSSGSSFLSRPKTPDHRAAPPPVFKAKTPERRISPVAQVEALRSEVVIGKKRPAPDDFEAGDNLPPQGFTADSLPSDRASGTTPRVRRVLSSIQSGFTPVRNHGMRGTIALPSPKRFLGSPSRPSAIINDVTNSPHHDPGTSIPTKSSKKSWLGKIRGVSAQSIGRPD